MTTKDEALRQALEALEFSKSYLDGLADVLGTSKEAEPGSASWHVDKAITACCEALARKDEQEWSGCATDSRFLKRGLCFATKEDAIAAAKAMLPVKGEEV